MNNKLLLLLLFSWFGFRNSRPYISGRNFQVKRYPGAVDDFHGAGYQLFNFLTALNDFQLNLWK